MSELLVVRSKIKDVAKMNVSSDFADGLSQRVEQMIRDAEKRAEANGRKTIRASDL